VPEAEQETGGHVPIRSRGANLGIDTGGAGSEDESQHDEDQDHVLSLHETSLATRT
jgi:hypothetical protein